MTDVNGWQTAYGYDDGASRPRYVASLASLERDLATAHQRFATVPERRLDETRMGPAA